MKMISFMGSAILCLPVLITVLQAANNSVTISETSGAPQPNRPVTVSRVFAQGEIANYPRPSISGSALPQWQANVMSHWPDGSVKHALITFTQTLSANSSTTVLFVNNANPCYLGNQATCDAAAPTQSQILSFNSSSWDADIETTAPSVTPTQKTDIRTMITAGFWRFWVQGPLMNQIIVEDRRPTLTYDYGYTWNSGTSSWSLATTAPQKSLHPIFFLTEYAGYTGVQVEYILENVWDDKIQSQTYNVALNSGLGLANSQYTKSGYLMPPATRWRKVFWDPASSAPGQISVDFNLPYVISTNALPNFDTSIKLASQVVADEYSYAYNGAYVNQPEGGSQDGTGKGWTSSDKCDLGGNGEWDYVMDDPGGRPDIGLLPRWNVSFLYAMSQGTTNWPQLYTVTMGNAECSPFPIYSHFREDQPGLWYDPGQTTDAFGHTFSRIARPGASTLASCQFCGTANTLKVVGPTTSGKWSDTDTAHQPNFAYLPYLLTGDWYWLEELDFWAAFTSGYSNPDVCNYCGHGSWAFLNQSGNEVRGQGWGMRSLADAWFMQPDSAIEAAYFRNVIDNNIAVREGEFNVTNGAYYNPSASSPWYWGRNTYAFGYANPLYIGQTTGVNLIPGNGVDETKTCLDNSSPWMMNIVHMAYGRAEEQGLSEIHTLRTTIVANLLGQIDDPNYNPYLSGAYKWGINNTHDGVAADCPSSPPYTTLFSTYAAIRNAFTSSTISGATAYFNSGKTDPEFGYPNIARAATSFDAAITSNGYSGATAWSWISTKSTDPSVNNNPKWAIVPRSTTSSGTTQLNRCDVNSDGVVNVLDVQLTVNQALGTAACSTGDVNGDGQCSVLDVQIVTNAVMTGTCTP